MRKNLKAIPTSRRKIKRIIPFPQVNKIPSGTHQKICFWMISGIRERKNALKWVNALLKIYKHLNRHVYLVVLFLCRISHVFSKQVFTDVNKF